MTELQQTANCYEMLHQLKYYECTDTGHPSLSMLMSMMTMVSDAHSIFMGLDRQKVEQSGGAWVVISYEGHLSAKQPRYGDQVILGTRATASNAFFALREFWMDDLHHHHYAHIKALFVMMNLQKRRLMKIPDELLAPFESPVQKRLDKPKKPGKLSGDFTSQQYRVRYYDIDVNHHVNNARYFDWLTDPLGAVFLRHHQPVAFTIQYQNEVQENATVESRLARIQDDGTTTSQHEVWSGGECCTSAEITWASVNNG